MTDNLQKIEGNAALADADIVERLRESDNDTEYVSPIGNEKRLTLAWEAAEARPRSRVQATARPA